MAAPKRRTSKMKQRTRLAAQAWRAPKLRKCQNCGSSTPAIPPAPIAVRTRPFRQGNRGEGGSVSSAGAAFALKIIAVLRRYHIDFPAAFASQSG
ncbi:MAG: 50S ribosomal protein L32 [Akkermansia sp.]